jgi:YD repeat-containing protein
VYAGPIHFLEGGTWREIETQLVPSEDPEFAFENAAGPFRVRFAANAQSEQLGLLEDSGDSIGFGLQGANPSEGVVQDSMISYPDVLPGVDLSYEVRPSGIKELIILKETPGPQSDQVTFDFPVSLNGFTLDIAGSGAIRVLDEVGKLVYRIPDPYMYDSSVDPQSGLAASSDSVALAVHGQGAEQTLRVSVDASWLRDPSRVYPVYVDPYLDKNNPTMDTYVKTNDSSGNAGESFLYVGTADGGTTKHRALLKWGQVRNQGSTSGNGLPNVGGATIDEAKLSLFQSGAPANCPSNSNQPVGVYRIDNGAARDWDHSVTFPGPSGFSDAPTQLDRVVNHKCPADRIDFNIRDTVRGWYSGTFDSTHGVVLRAEVETASNNLREFKSADNASTGQLPELRIRWDTPPRTPTNLTNVSATTSDGSAGPSTTPTLRATYIDDDWCCANFGADRGFLKFQVYTTDTLGNPTNTMVASGTSPSWGDGDPTSNPPGDDLSWQVPAGALTPGNTYKWRVQADDSYDGPTDSLRYSGWSDYKTYRVFTAACAAPNISWPVNHQQRTWYPESTPTFTWDLLACASKYRYRNKDLTSQSLNCEIPPTGSETATNAETTKSFTVQDGKHCFTVAGIGPDGQQGATGPFEYWTDVTKPDTPSFGTNGCPAGISGSNGYLATSTPTVSYSASDLTSGRDHYEYQYDSLSGWQATTPAQSTTQDSVTLPSKTDGTYFFTIRAYDLAGNKSDDAECQVKIDATVPAPSPTSSTHPDPTREYGRDASFSWNIPTNPESGIKGYSIELATTTTSIDSLQDTTQTNASYTGLSSGTKYFHVRAIAGSGAASIDGPSSQFQIQVQEFGFDPSVTCRSHPDPNQWYSADQGTFDWVSSPPASGIKGYAYSVDKNLNGVPSDTPFITANTVTTQLLQGPQHFHVKAQSNKGRWSDPGSCSFKVDSTNPDAPPAVLSTTHAKEIVFNNPTVRMDWLAASDHDPGSSSSCSVNAGCSGLLEYQYKFSASSDEPGGFWASAETTPPGTTAVEKELAPPTPTPVTYFFHLRARDLAGNPSSSVTYGPIRIGSDGVLTPLAPTLNNLTELFSAQSDEMGLEQFYAYKQLDLGSALGFVNLKTGNLVVQDDDFVISGIGLNTVIRHTYNSQRDDGFFHDTGIGRGWSISVADAAAGPSLSAASVGIDVNAPISFAQVVSRDASNVITADDRLFEFTDGDGTAHRFVKDALGASPRWVSPPGVDLKLTEVGSDFELTRPDGVKYVITHQTITDPEPAQQPAATISPLVLSEIRDRNGNVLTFAYDYRPLTTGVGGVRVRSIFHNSGREVARFSYNPSGDLLRIEGPPSSGQLTDPNRRNSFFVTNGKLTKVIDSDGTADARSNNYEYVTLERGALQPVDMLVAVQDGIGSAPQGAGHKTQFCAPPPTQPDTCFARDGEALRIKDIVDREGKKWTLTYSETTLNNQPVRQTVWKDPLVHATTYLITLRDRVAPSDKRLTGGNIRRITDAGANAGPIVTNYFWTENRLSSKSDAFGATTYRYNSLGQLLEMVTPPVNEASRVALPASDPRKLSAGMADPVRTTLNYEYKSQVPGCAQPTDDPAYAISTEGSCSLIGELVRTTAGDGSGDQRETELGYDSRGNLADVWKRAVPGASDQDDRHTHMDYAPTNGLLSTVDGPRDASDPGMGGLNDVSTYGYGTGHTGQPTTISDAYGHAQVLTYNAYGQALTHLDRESRLDTFSYDERGNLKTAMQPDGGKSAITWDLNDNLDTVTTPRGVATASPTDDFQTKYIYDGNERLVEINSPGADYAATRTKVTMTYRGDGLLNSQSRPYQNSGFRADTTYSYFANGLPSSMSVPTGTGLVAQNSYLYDSAGRLSQVTEPVVDDGGTRPVTTFSYSPAGTLTKETKTSSTGGNRVWEFAYDPHGGRVQAILPRQNARTDTDFNKFGEVKKLHRYLSATSKLTTTYGYDRAGNSVTVDQPGPSGGLLQSTFQYDPLNRLKVQTRPGEASTAFVYDNDGLQTARMQGSRTLSTVYNNDRSIRYSAASQSGSLRNVAACKLARRGHARPGLRRGRKSPSVENGFQRFVGRPLRWEERRIRVD